MDLNFRTLYASEIECRVGQINNKGLSLLLYKDARCDMTLLDETVGPLNWMRTHSRDNANCIVSIWDDAKKAWVSKEDTGTESKTEAEKGLASDSFKRACVNWGIGRELYTAPRIWIPAERVELSKDGRKLYDRLRVRQITYNDRREIESLVIENVSRNRQVVYTYGCAATPIICERCRKPVTGVVTKDGRQLTPEQVTDIGRRAFRGGAYCGDCQKALLQARKERAEAMSRENAG